MRADMLSAMGVIGPDDVQHMEAQARGVIGDEVERLDIVEIVIRTQVMNPHATMIEVGQAIQSQIVKAVRQG